MAGKVNILAEMLDKFLQNGGILLRRNTNSAGEPVIEQKTSERDWHHRLTFTKITIRDTNLDFITRRKKQFFKNGEA